MWSHYTRTGWWWNTGMVTCAWGAPSPVMAVKLHSQNKLCHVLKYVSFIRKQSGVLFTVKRSLSDAALVSSLLHGCESWMGADVKPVIELNY